MKQTLTKPFSFFALTLFAIGAGHACSAQNKTVETPIQYYKDSTVFTSLTFSDFGAHGSRIKSKRFTMHIPAGVKPPRRYDSDYTALEFANGQSILVLMNHTPAGEDLQDSTWTADKDKLQAQFGAIGFKGDRNKFLPRPDRKSVVYKRQGQEILLLNIKTVDFQNFEQAVETFRLLD